MKYRIKFINTPCKEFQSPAINDKTNTWCVDDAKGAIDHSRKEKRREKNSLIKNETRMKTLKKIFSNKVNACEQ